VAEVLDKIGDRDHSLLGDEDRDAYEQVRGAILDLVPTRGSGMPSPRSVGMKLNHIRRRVVDGRYLDKKDGRLGNRWFVAHIERKTNGTNGTNPATPCEKIVTLKEDIHTGGCRGTASPVSPAPTCGSQQESACGDDHAPPEPHTCGPKPGPNTGCPTCRAGTYVEQRLNGGVRLVCRDCGKFYGYKRPEVSEQLSA
jgi:hypothetical protein